MWSRTNGGIKIINSYAELGVTFYTTSESKTFESRDPEVRQKQGVSREHSQQRFYSQYKIIISVDFHVHAIRF